MEMIESLIDERNQILARQHNQAKSFNEYLQDKYKKIFKKHFPKRKYKFDLINELPETKALQERNKELGTKFWQNWGDKIKKIEMRLIDAVAGAEIPKSESWEHWDTIWGSTYATQGFGCDTYNRAAAQKLIDKANFYGLEAEARPANEFKSGYGIKYIDYQIWVKTTQAGLEMLKYKPEPPFREVIRNLLKKQINPYVFYPFLPQHGGIEALKLDWQGNDLG